MFRLGLLKNFFKYLKLRVFKIPIFCPSLDACPSASLIPLHNEILLMSEAVAEAVCSQPEVSKSVVGFPGSHTVIADPCCVVVPL